jgi:predicted ATPase
VERDLPTGTVTFLFTDIAGSTRMLLELGPVAYAEALAEHRRVLRDAFARHGGIEVDTQGDAFFVAFPTAPGALASAADAQRSLEGGPIRVRMGIHTGTPHLTDEGYVGADVHRAARVAAAGHGGQVLVSAATAALTGSEGLRDLGPHRLKDLTTPERIYQLGQADFPSLKSLHQTNLPVSATSFLGRERELAQVTGLLERDDVRLVTLTGPGGTGKTRLSLAAAAASAERYLDGVWWVPLDTLRDPALVLPTAAQALGASNGLAEHIGSKQVLLLFDNFEQVVAAASELGELLSACPNLDLLATSRERLHLAGEQEYPVPPMAAPEAVELFIARARALRPDFEPDQAVAGICRRLDDLPLAIELAAASVTVLSPAQILARLEQRLPLLTNGARNLPERQRTLRGVIAWSHELLTPAEQRLFARFSVFHGGATLEATEAVVEAELDTLASLVDKSLLRQREERFSMLETIREYAAERLEASGEEHALRRHHAEHFVALAEEAEPNLRGDPGHWLDRLEREHDNVRAAIDWLEASGEGELVLRLTGAMSRFWYLRGYPIEGRHRLESALRADQRPTAARARALNGASIMAGNSGDVADARLRAEEGLTLHRALGDAWGTAYSGFLLAYSLAEEGDLTGARRRFEDSLVMFRELRDEHLSLLASRNVAWLCDELGEHDRARALHEENLRRARELPNERVEASTLAALAMYPADEGRFAEGLNMLRQSLTIWRDLQNRLEIAVTLARFASVLARAGRPEIAARLLARADALHDEVGFAVEPWIARMNKQTRVDIRTQIDEPAVAQAREQGRALTVDDAVALALGV